MDKHRHSDSDELCNISFSETMSYESQTEVMKIFNSVSGSSDEYQIFLYSLFRKKVERKAQGVLQSQVADNP